MKRESRGKHGGLATGLTPMLDTLFLLLFALLATSEARDDAPTETLRVDLPEVAADAGGSETEAEQRELVFEIDAASRVRLALGGEATREVAGEAELDAALGAALAAPDAGGVPEGWTVVLVADANARHGVIAQLLQQLALRGFVRVELSAQGAAGEVRFGAGPAGPAGPAGDGE